ncbi:MAG: HDIG domain-containing protein [Clostridia bacterium]|nr:HDIG domain-containing protein [Clostridia bacterium]
MNKKIPSREDALKLLNEYNKNESLLKHAFSVEAVMRHFAEYYNEDVEKWGVIGLIHDLDYEQYPEMHCKKTEELLRQNGWPEDSIYSVTSHGFGICTENEPKHIMEKTLYTIDELTGLVAATALMRPSRSILDLETKSVVKKWKQKSFATGVDRELIEKGSAMMGMEINEIITMTIEAMRKIAEEIGLSGDL